MKTKKYLYSLIVILLAISSCRKDDNAKLPGLSRVPQPLITKDESTDVAISFQEPDLFKASFEVGLYFEDDVKPQKFDVVIVKNENHSKVITLQKDVTVFPTKVDITGPQLAELFGEAISLGDKFDIGVDITTQDGKKYEAFPLVGEGYGSAVGTQPDASIMIRYEAVCEFKIEEYAGDFEVLVDEWEDFGEGSTLTLTARGTDELLFDYPTEINPKPAVIKVNTATNTVSIVKQGVGDYGPGWPYGELYVETAGGGTANFVAPCDETLTLNINYTVGAGGFGNKKLVLKKK